ncbi:phospholipid phosphatase 5-like [Mya arenaria]|uniref:phospholipid phosphatase 5-like n=1 Tax=Mya arenaria TaxID=6604 RepID=UPI0022E7DB30|nr:phospholipid phosphatase 5-like [Mya arenaria]
MKALGSTTMKSEIAVRIFLMAFFFYTDKMPGFRRKIQQEEYWLYKFPRTPDYYPSRYLWCTLFFAPVVTGWLMYYFTRDLVDFIQFILGSVLSIFLGGSLVNCIKVGVGRPRPDFLERCFPDGTIGDPEHCTGDLAAVTEGYKSFPSGHATLCFSCLAFISLYLAGKLHIFNMRGKGSAWRIVVVILPLLWATMIGVSRTADYHHHWQDVTVGSILGLTVAYLTYRSYYPALQRHNSHLPYVSLSHTDTAIQYTDHPITPEHKAAMAPNFNTRDGVLKSV